MPTCPHCNQEIDLVSAEETAAMIPSRNKPGQSIAEGTLALWRKKGDFPEPWMEVGNRVYWLREVVDQVVSEIEEREASRGMSAIARDLSKLTAAERKRRLQQLERMSEELRKDLDREAQTA